MLTSTREVLFQAFDSATGRVMGELGVELRMGLWYAWLTLRGEERACKAAPTRDLAVQEATAFREAANTMMQKIPDMGHFRFAAVS